MGGEDARYAQIWSSEQWVSQAGWLVGAQAFGRPLPPCASREIGYRWLNSLISLRHSSLTSPHNLSAGAEPHSGGDAIKDFADAGTCSHGAGAQDITKMAHIDLGPSNIFYKGRNPNCRHLSKPNHVLCGGNVYFRIITR